MTVKKIALIAGIVVVLAGIVGFSVYQSRKNVVAVQTGRVYASVRLPYGKHDVGLVAARPLRLVARLARPLTERVVAAEAVSLPLRRGTVLGRVEIWAGTKLVGQRDLVSSRTVNRPGLGGRLGFYAGRTLHHLAHLL